MKLRRVEQSKNRETLLKSCLIQKVSVFFTKISPLS